MKTSLYKNLCQYTNRFNGCHEDEPVHESMPVHEGVQQIAMKTNLYINQSQCTKGFSRLP